MTRSGPLVVALSGGIGGAKLALGLRHILAPATLMVVCNTGDDFEHLGLRVSPDIDTVMYTLAGLNNPQTGWGRDGETWNFMEALTSLGGETWFRLGDRDLATHIERTRRLAAGEPLSEVTNDFCRRLGIESRVVPMCDDPVRTMVLTGAGTLAFQHYFVRDSCEPEVTGFVFEGAQTARPSPGLIETVAAPDLQAIFICPSNPFISIDPILAVPGMRAALASSSAPVIAVSPIVGGNALKGPTAKMMRELGVPSTAAGVAAHYGDLLDGFVLDNTDAQLSESVPMPTLVTETVMNSLADRVTLARETVRFADQLRAATR